MTLLFKKLNLKHQSRIVVLNSPITFEPELNALTGIAIIRDSREVTSIDFALAFASRKSDRDKLATLLIKNANTDAVL